MEGDAPQTNQDERDAEHDRSESLVATRPDGAHQHPDPDDHIGKARPRVEGLGEDAVTQLLAVGGADLGKDGVVQGSSTVTATAGILCIAATAGGTDNLP